MRAVIMRKLDNLGRIVLPKELRDLLGYKEGTALDVFLDDDDTVLLKKSSYHCVLCGSANIVWTDKGKSLCNSCMEKIKGEKEQRHGDENDCI